MCILHVSLFIVAGPVTKLTNAWRYLKDRSVARTESGQTISINSGNDHNSSQCGWEGQVEVDMYESLPSRPANDRTLTLRQLPSTPGTIVDFPVYGNEIPEESSENEVYAGLDSAAVQVYQNNKAKKEKSGDLPESIEPIENEEDTHELEPPISSSTQDAYQNNRSPEDSPESEIYNNDETVQSPAGDGIYELGDAPSTSILNTKQSHRTIPCAAQDDVYEMVDAPSISTTTVKQMRKTTPRVVQDDIYDMDGAPSSCIKAVNQSNKIFHHGATDDTYEMDAAVNQNNVDDYVYQNNVDDYVYQNNVDDYVYQNNVDDDVYKNNVDDYVYQNNVDDDVYKNNVDDYVYQDNADDDAYQNNGTVQDPAAADIYEMDDAPSIPSATVDQMHKPTPCAVQDDVCETTPRAVQDDVSETTPRAVQDDVCETTPCAVQDDMYVLDDVLSSSLAKVSREKKISQEDAEDHIYEMDAAPPSGLANGNRSKKTNVPACGEDNVYEMDARVEEHADKVYEALVSGSHI